jgi:hypothetical protein
MASPGVTERLELPVWSTTPWRTLLNGAPLPTCSGRREAGVSERGVVRDRAALA